MTAPAPAGVGPPATTGEAAYGVYVHVPFCARRCDYCAFATWTDRHHLMERYARACVTEVRRAQLPPATSVFFGGGTPSLLPVRLLLSILDAVVRTDDCEVTVECNPESVDVAMLSAFRRGGVTRLSFGVQSMVPHVLASLGRSHAPEAVVAAVRAAGEAGFDDLNIDLIFGGAGETREDWARSLESALDLNPVPTHVSAYALTVERGTPLARDVDRHPDDDDLAAKYLDADAALTAAGFCAYEISNWSRPGRECAHNLLYWRQGDYCGIGCAAHSHASGRRWWNVRTPERYIEAIESGRSAMAGQEVLDGPARRIERLQLALRTRDGVGIGDLEGIDELTGLVCVEGGRVSLTPRGRMLANEVALRLT